LISPNSNFFPVHPSLLRFKPVEVQLDALVRERILSLFLPGKFQIVFTLAQAEAIDAPLPISISCIAVEATFTCSLHSWVEVENELLTFLHWQNTSCLYQKWNLL
jgi:hypothetical protein